MSLGYSDLSSAEKHFIDLVSVAAVLGSLVDFLPHVAAVFTIVWTGIRIWETDTVQKLFGRLPKT